MAAHDESSPALTRTPFLLGSEQPAAAPKGSSALSIEHSHTCIRPGCESPSSVCLACYAVEAGVADRLEALEARLTRLTAQRDHERRLRARVEHDLEQMQGRAASLENQLLEAKSVREYHRRMWSRLAKVMGQDAGKKPEELVQLARFESLLEVSVQRWVDESS